MTNTHQLYVRHSTVPIEEAVEAIKKTAMLGANPHGRNGKSTLNGVTMNTKSVRVRTFAFKGTCCVTCGIKGTHFAIEHAENDKTEAWHLNLWALDDAGNERLMTHDHILARSLGGRDHLDNTQTMCYDCNQEKSIGEREQYIINKGQAAEQLAQKLNSE